MNKVNDKTTTNQALPEDVAQNPLPEERKQELSKGFIKIPRAFFESGLWREKRKFSHAEAFLDIIEAARFGEEPSREFIKQKPLICRQGECLKCYETWAKRWNVDKTKARRMVKNLEKLGLILITNEGVTTRISVCNYHDLHGKGHAPQSDRARSTSHAQSDKSQPEEDQYPTHRICT